MLDILLKTVRDILTVNMNNATTTSEKGDANIPNTEKLQVEKKVVVKEVDKTISDINIPDTEEVFESIVDKSTIKSQEELVDYSDKYSNTFFIVRKNYNKNETMGEIRFLTGEKFPSLEKPWKNNQLRVSCIPEGTYICRKRVSGIVQRTTARRKKKYLKGWEITNVPNRTYIMFHIGNTAKDLLGCVAMGLKVGKLGGSNAVLSSGDAFDKFMSRMEAHTEWKVVILNQKDYDKLNIK